MFFDDCIGFHILSIQLLLKIDKLMSILLVFVNDFLSVIQILFNLLIFWLQLFYWFK